MDSHGGGWVCVCVGGGGQASPVQVKVPYTGSILMYVGSSCKHTGVYNIHLPRKIRNGRNNRTKHCICALQCSPSLLYPVHLSLTFFLWDVGHRQTTYSIAPDVTPHNAASHLRLFCLRTEISSKNEIKNKNHS